MLYVFGIVFGFMWGGLGTVTTALVGDVFGMSSIGVIMGATSAMWALGAATGPALAGYIFDMSNSYSIAFAIGAIGILMIAPLMGLMGKKEVWRKVL
jgi:MFS family permease